MSGTTAELYWFPRSKYQDRFITWGSEINLYQVNDDVPGERLQTSLSRFFICDIDGIDDRDESSYLNHYLP